MIFGGALLLTPGFLTDVLGLLLLVPPTRALFRALGTKLAKSCIRFGPNLGGWGVGAGDFRRSGRRPDDIDGTAEEIVDDPLLDPGRSGTR